MIWFTTKLSDFVWFAFLIRSSGINVSIDSRIRKTGKISAQPHPTLCIQFLNRENNDKNNTFPLGKQICFTIVWGCAETLPKDLMTGHYSFTTYITSKWKPNAVDGTK